MSHSVSAYRRFIAELSIRVKKTASQFGSPGEGLLHSTIYVNASHCFKWKLLARHLRSLHSWKVMLDKAQEFLFGDPLIVFCGKVLRWEGKPAQLFDVCILYCVKDFLGERHIDLAMFDV